MNASLKAYSVVAQDARGALFFKRVEAASEESARQIVSGDGSKVMHCDLAKQSRMREVLNGVSSLLGRSKAIDTVVFSQDMATLLDAGVTVKEAIHALNRQEKAPAKLAVLSQIDTFIAQGSPFSEALAKTNAFPELLIATVAASEETGDLGVGLSRYAKHQQSLRVVRDRVVGACVYPLLLLIVGSLVVVLLLGVVVPRFSTLIDSTGKELPFLSKVLMGWGVVVTIHRLIDHSKVALTDRISRIHCYRLRYALDGQDGSSLIVIYEP